MDREIRTGHANLEEMRVREEGEKYDFCGYVNRKTASQRVKRIHTTWTLRSFSFFLDLLSELLFDYLIGWFYAFHHFLILKKRKIVFSEKKKK